MAKTMHPAYLFGVGGPNHPVVAPVAPAPGPAPAPPEQVRPPGVSPLALWFDSENEWQLRLTDDAGLLDGPFRSWRADGTLRTIASHRHGKQVGEVWRFHPDGSLFSFGAFVDGAPHGVHRCYASVYPHAEQLQSCCVPPGAWQLQQTYNRGASIDRGWFNRAGVRLLETGELCPARPSAVPRQAWFNEDCRAWEAGVLWEEGGATGTRRRWSTDGVLRLVEQIVRGKRNGRVQTFAESGTLAWQAHFVDDRLWGAFTERDLPPQHFADPAVRHEAGTFTDDQPTGLWRYLDAAGAVLHERDLGSVMDENTLPVSPVLVDERQEAAAWRSLADSLFAEGRVAEALLGAARVSAEEGDPQFLAAALGDWTMPLGPAAGRNRANDVVTRAAGRLLPLVDGLRRGGNASVLLWEIAKALQAKSHAALDLVTASFLLSPDWTPPLTTRVLLHAALGDAEAARTDTLRIRVDSPEQAAFLDLYLRVAFPRFDFWPARETLEPSATEDQPRPERTPAEVKAVIQRYATRIGHLRGSLRARVADDVPFMIPDLTALLPDGPTTLSRWMFSMSVEEYEGCDPAEAGVATDGDTDAETIAKTSPEPDTSDPIVTTLDDAEGAIRSVEISVDEGHDLAMDTATVPDILRRARADWSGLTWLCWAVGLNAPGLPDAIRPPPAFGRAAILMLERTWRCRDKLNTSGLLALTKGIPGFDWEGTPIDFVPTALADVALDEYVEARAVFSWLCDPANRSPWQEDLRVTT